MPDTIHATLQNHNAPFDCQDANGIVLTLKRNTPAITAGTPSCNIWVQTNPVPGIHVGNCTVNRGFHDFAFQVGCGTLPAIGGGCGLWIPPYTGGTIASYNLQAGWTCSPLNVVFTNCVFSSCCCSIGGAALDITVTA